jgi:dipeptidyl aminopeptidase/acylaminoacyl peptidase
VAYLKPPKEVLDVLHAPAAPNAIPNPPRTHLLLVEPRNYPPVAELAAPTLRLAGLRINPANNGRHSPMGVATAATVKEISTGKELKLQVPAGARLTGFEWSPDGKQFAVLNYTNTSVELWVGSTGSPVLRKVAGLAVNDSLGGAVEWLPGSTELLVRAVVANRGPAPPAQAIPLGPNVQETAGGAQPQWTLQDMLRSPHDEKLFDYYCSSQLMVVNSATLKSSPIGKPAIFSRAEPSPDGKLLLVSLVKRPYSYLHAYADFPQDLEVWERTGKPVKLIHSAPLRDKVPLEGVPTGPRNVQWRATDQATLLWWEALDEGDPKKKVPHRDRLMMQRAPFQSAPLEVTKTQHRGASLVQGEGGLVIVGEVERERRWLYFKRVYLDDSQGEQKPLWNYSMRERYNNPGSPLTRVLPSGRRIMRQSGDFVFFAGQGATPQGDRPFLDRVNLKTGEKERLFRAGEKGYESVVDVLDDEGTRFLTRYESPTEPPNLFIRVRGSDVRQPLTAFTDPTPQLRKIKAELVKYKRADGVDLSFTLYLPPDYQPGTRLPTILYAYPLEFTDPGVAGQVGGSTQRFVQMRGASHLFLLLSGYAILHDATIPIVGDPETVNNTYVEQLTAGAKAAIDKAVELGVTDPNRVGVTGHSYGGFMTMNLLAHTDLFRTGVARSGAYNRTLTPFGFQSERRTYWQASEVYLKMSPFQYADKVNEPVLLIHGEADNNAGTHPMQSERMYQAIRGNGGTARLVMLPAESHGYAARESIEHVLAETLLWFDRYLKSATALTSGR